MGKPYLYGLCAGGSEGVIKVGKGLVRFPNPLASWQLGNLTRQVPAPVELAPACEDL